MSKRLARGVLAGGAGVLVLAVVGGALYFRSGDGATVPPAEPVSALQPGASGSAASASDGAAGLSAPAGSTSAGASPASSAQAPVAVGGWVPVDPAAWKAQVDAYEAMSPDPVPAGVGNLAEFRADCQYSHSAADDPIVFPGLPGASHMHSFVGNKATNATTTPADLTKFTATSCKPALDHSAYWVPTLYEAGTNQPVETTGFRVYYRTRMNTSTGQLPMPNGLRMIAGDAKKSVPTPRGSQGQFYCAFYGPGDLDGIARSTNGNWPICGGDATLHFMLSFPDCWDGKNLDSPNHKDHVAFGANNTCPKTHPVKIPALTFDIQYGAKGTTEGYYLSSDKQGRSASSMHGDAFVMWDATTMNKRTKNCLLQRRTCDNNGYQQ